MTELDLHTGHAWVNGLGGLFFGTVLCRDTVAAQKVPRIKVNDTQGDSTMCDMTASLQSR